MADCIQADFQKLCEKAEAYKKLSKEYFEIAQELKGLVNSLDWEEGRPYNFDKNMRKLEMEINEHGLHAHEFATYLNTAAEKFQKAEDFILWILNAAGENNENLAAVLEQIATKEREIQLANFAKQYYYLDKDKLTPWTSERLDYLLDKVLTMEDGEIAEEHIEHARGDYMRIERYTREQYVEELNSLLETLRDPNYRIFEESMARGIKCIEGELQMLGGYGEITVGTGFCAGGITAIPGIYLLIDGGSNMKEGGDKVFNSIASDTINAPTHNIMRDDVFSRTFGEEAGPRYYSYASIAVTVYCIYDGATKLSELNSTEYVKVQMRDKNVLNAYNNKLPVVDRFVEKGDKLIVIREVYDPKLKTPPILGKAEINLKDVSKLRADMSATSIFLCTDISNTPSTVKAGIEELEDSFLNSNLSEVTP